MPRVAAEAELVAPRREVTPANREYLESKLGRLDRQADDAAARDAEAEEALKQLTKAEARHEVGIYVYSLPHYLRYPFDQVAVAR